jgi:Domain of unknown function (DUF4202)
MSCNKMPNNRLTHAIELFDAANAKDPNADIDDGKSIPKELLYAQRMSAMLQRFAPQADETVCLAVRAQHIERWKIPRGNYPMNRAGYYEWRTTLYGFHADRAGELMREAGYDDATIARVASMLKKENLAEAATQMMEDVVALVFLESYIADFAAQHADYDEARWRVIIAKTWRKMSLRGQAFALSGIQLPHALAPLIKKAISA